jgi:hypothetical protein
MKNFKLLFIGLLFSSNIFAQSPTQNTTILPNKIVVPKVNSLPVFTTSDKGSMVFNNADRKMYFCDGVSWQAMSVGGTNTSYNSGFHVSINSNTTLTLTQTPQQILFSNFNASYNDGNNFGPNNSLLPSANGTRRWIYIKLNFLHGANQPSGALFLRVKDKLNNISYLSQFVDSIQGSFTNLSVSGIVPANREIIVTLNTLNNTFTGLLFSDATILSGYTLY